MKMARGLMTTTTDLLLLLLLFSLDISCNRHSVDAYAFQSRRAFVKAAALATTAAACVGVVGVENAASIDVSGLSIEGAAPGRAPNQPASGPLAGSKLGFQVGGGPRPEEEVRKIDEARYKAARGSNNPAFLDGVPREPTDNSIDTKWTTR
mmetsp:Transcript_2991/g.4870  ORF Transcript_2991/g.4870 Transcript_2991/m.4870 type:complete len:151 (-) Transcript_2991:230-682(-)|eukprot:CAMPEP_0119014340 /NCGR_PEP_ID=MMETSP1176-20130426/9535_1 /TAXON_ID=265551 /ORGANISM="Synedropsis recta cf, Strain CCMP1620" /LENGTH=150 /DNA_ID=CAMNT_0006967495 /DNA_START=83 /DNA_END=535 /DNA_ORIENTATION=-